MIPPIIPVETSTGKQRGQAAPNQQSVDAANWLAMAAVANLALEQLTAAMAIWTPPIQRISLSRAGQDPTPYGPREQELQK